MITLYTILLILLMVGFIKFTFKDYLMTTSRYLNLTLPIIINIYFAILFITSNPSLLICLVYLGIIIAITILIFITDKNYNKQKLVFKIGMIIFYAFIVAHLIYKLWIN